MPRLSFKIPLVKTMKANHLPRVLAYQTLVSELKAIIKLLLKVYLRKGLQDLRQLANP